ncbi:isocitrate lyase/PEP mutase family protein [Kutzneria sp. CA-103260]|uniref:isocitrate lyase/PEP mutase family protein n=1 Tax=Kutzneria sp. CA-103260 TaxID=2802641 RepID=UPI001BABFE11|nr:isocitrate lyase/phosphoenolpyruvate mutase family protein [Kutzneria sp. CA-103260]QUQ63363.1 isocitrate lyase/phosphoenolpyruvate mutase family protein [Kutzneria sp. CA-103260]
MTFRELHRSGFFVLPNAWDPASARLLSTLPGVPALGTTSAGVAAALGLPDGQRMPLATMLRAVAAIVEFSAVPVSADLEGGYGDVRATIRAAVDVGVVGVNIEDVRYPDGVMWSADEAADRIAAARSVDADLVINARTDEWWSGDRRFDEGVARLRRFLDAGADCLFVPGLPEELIPDLVAALPGAAINVLASPTLPSLESLANMGVRRVSTGSSLARLAWGAARDALTGVLGGAGFGGLAGNLSYGELTEALDGRN